MPTPDAVRTRWPWAFAVVALVHVAVLYWPRVTVEGPVSWTDKVVHLLVFGVPVTAGLLSRLPAAYVVVPFAVHAPVSELVQNWLLPGRSGDVGDALADLAGVVIGVAVVMVWRSRER